MSAFVWRLTCPRPFQILVHKALWNNNQSDEANQVLIIWLNYWEDDSKICIKRKWEENPIW